MAVSLIKINHAEIIRISPQASASGCDPSHLHTPTVADRAAQSPMSPEPYTLARHGCLRDVALASQLWLCVSRKRPGPKMRDVRRQSVFVDTVST